MSSTSKSYSKSCFKIERKRLMKDIRHCDYCSASWEEHHRCLGRAAKASGKRSKACLIS